MSTIIVASLLVISVIVISKIFVSINTKNHKKRTQQLLIRFNDTGSTFGLSFSSQEILKNKILGLDGIHRKFLVMEFENDTKVTCIDLSEIRECILKKEYDSVNHGSDRKAKIEQQLRGILLQFQFRNKREPVNISFYDSSINSIYEMAPLEAKAKDWEAMLSKMIIKGSPVMV